MSFKTQVSDKNLYYKKAHATPHSPKGEASPHTFDCALATPPLGGWGVGDEFS
jgi:hypothetical protein